MFPWRLMCASDAVEKLLAKLPDDVRELCLSAKWARTTASDAKEFVEWYALHNKNVLPKGARKEWHFEGEFVVRWVWIDSPVWNPPKFMAGVFPDWEKAWRGSAACKKSRRHWVADVGWVKESITPKEAKKRSDLGPEVRGQLDGAQKAYDARQEKLRAEEEERVRQYWARQEDYEKVSHRAVLGVGMGSTSDEIKLAYRRLAASHHPDRGGDVGKMQEINAAYAALT